MDIQKNTSLLKYNTFSIDAKAEYFVSIADKIELKEILHQKFDNIFILGGGSNILFTSDVSGLVLHNNIKGVKIKEETKDHVYVEFGAGENWHEMVLYTIDKGWGGLQNLSLIPGNIGTAPMQNIGAYGVEIKDVFHELRATHLKTGEEQIFNNDDCRFAYRESIFKGKEKGNYIITHVTLRLNKKHKINSSYGAINKRLEEMNISNPDIKSLSDAVISIRKEKLPDPAILGNAGSFFKNPVIATDKFDKLKDAHPGIPSYPSGTQTKIPAAWLLDQCGWKGYQKGDAGVYKNHALVLVNHGKAKGNEIYNLSEEMKQSVASKFDIELHCEVNIV